MKWRRIMRILPLRAADDDEACAACEDPYIHASFERARAAEERAQGLDERARVLQFEIAVQSPRERRRRVRD